MANSTPTTSPLTPNQSDTLRRYVPTRIFALVAAIPVLTVLGPFVAPFIGMLLLAVIFTWLMAELLAVLYAIVRGRFERSATIGLLIAAVPVQVFAAQLPIYVHWALNVAAYDQTYRESLEDQPDALGVFFPWRDGSAGPSPNHEYVDGICRDFPASDIRPSRRWIGGAGWEDIAAGGSYFEDRLTSSNAIWGPWYACSFEVT